MYFKFTSRAGFLFLSAASFCVLSFSGTTIAQSSPAGPVDTTFQRSANYRIGPSDIIDVVIDNNDALSRRGVRVSNAGTIKLAMLDGDVMVACRTEGELADQLRDRYKKYLLDPRVSVTVKSFEARPIAVIGAVNSPGRFQLQRSMRLLELLALVNGPSGSAGRTIQILRDPDLSVSCDAAAGTQSVSPGAQSGLITLPLAETLKGVELANPQLRAGDIVTVLQAEQAYIYGNIKSAMAVNLREPVSLNQAIVMAGGLASGAQTDKIKISRLVSGSLARSEVVINLKEIRKRGGEEIYLQANDLVEIPGPTGSRKVFNSIIKSIIPSIIPAFTGLPITIVP